MMEYRIEPRAAKLGNRRHRSSAVELSIRNRVVVGSIPTGGSEKSCYGGGWRLVKVGGGGCRKTLRRIAEWCGPQAVIPVVSRRGSPIRKAPHLAFVPRARP